MRSELLSRGRALGYGLAVVDVAAVEFAEEVFVVVVAVLDVLEAVSGEDVAVALGAGVGGTVTASIMTVRVEVAVLPAAT